MDYAKKRFKEREKEPMYWYNKGADLHAAAGSLYYCMDSENNKAVCDWLSMPEGFHMGIAAREVFPMLCGLSLELAYKAIILAKKQEFKLTHKLNDLREKAGIHVDEDGRALLEIYTHIVVWSGKYPTPSKFTLDEDFKNLVSEHLYDDVKFAGTLKIRRPKNLLNWESFEKLWQEASDEFFRAFI